MSLWGQQIVLKVFVYLFLIIKKSIIVWLHQSTLSLTHFSFWGQSSLIANAFDYYFFFKSSSLSRNDTNMSEGGRKRMVEGSKENLNLPTDSKRSLFLMFIKMFGVQNDSICRIPVCFWVSVMTQSTRRKIYCNQCKICSYQRRKMRLGKENQKRGSQDCAWHYSQ